MSLKSGDVNKFDPEESISYTQPTVASLKTTTFARNWQINLQFEFPAFKNKKKNKNSSPGICLETPRQLGLQRRHI